VRGAFVPHSDIAALEALGFHPLVTPAPKRTG
jgi:hypothetical protein